MKLKFWKKNRYYFSPESLSFIKTEVSLLEIFLKKFFKHVPFSIGIGVVLFMIAYNLFDSPREKNLLRENKHLTFEYKILNNRIENLGKYITDLQNRDDNVYRPIFEAEPIPASVRMAGIGGVNRYSELERYPNAKEIIEVQKKLDKYSKQIYIQSKSYDEIVRYIKSKEKMLASIPAIQPISTKDLIRFGSGFGLRLHPILGYYRMHYGVDLTAATGKKVYAAGDGVIFRSEYSGNGFGNNVIINHGYSYKTVYAHLSKILVKEGQHVKRGEVIGLVGATGLATSSHLHYEVHKNERPVDPVNYYFNDLSDTEYEEMIKNSANANTHIFED